MPSTWANIDAAQLEVFVAVLHGIWRARNRAVWEAALSMPREVYLADIRDCGN